MSHVNGGAVPPSTVEAWLLEVGLPQKHMAFVTGIAPLIHSSGLRSICDVIIAIAAIM